VWDKVYQKLTDVEEETWLLRAVESTALFFSSEVEKAEQFRFVYRFNHRAPVLIETCFRTQLGSAYLHLAMESQRPEFRRRVIASVGYLAAVAPETANKLVRSGLTAYLTRRRTSLSKSQTSSTEDEKPVIRTQPRLLAFLSASTAFGKDEDNIALREKLLSETIVLAHHPEICKCD
jgi:hypothetical protein